MEDCIKLYKLSDLSKNLDNEKVVDHYCISACPQTRLCNLKSTSSKRISFMLSV